jgi:hypothetical protein
VLDALDAARAEAFASADPARLAAVYAPGSPALAADTVLVQELAAAGQTAIGVRHAVHSATVRRLSADTAQLRVVDTLAAYEVHARTGAVVRRVPARGQAAYHVELARTPAGWRLVRLTPG